MRRLRKILILVVVPVLVLVTVSVGCVTYNMIRINAKVGSLPTFPSHLSPTSAVNYVTDYDNHRRNKAWFENRISAEGGLSCWSSKYKQEGQTYYIQVDCGGHTGGGFLSLGHGIMQANACYEVIASGIRSILEDRCQGDNFQPTSGFSIKTASYDETSKKLFVVIENTGVADLGKLKIKAGVVKRYYDFQVRSEASFNAPMPSEEKTYELRAKSRPGRIKVTSSGFLFKEYSLR